MSLAEHLKKQINGAAGAVRQAFRGVLTANNSATPTQLSQVSALADENIDGVEIIQHFGFTSHPPPDTDVIVLPLGGKTSHGVVIATEHGGYRVQSLPCGATAVYDQSGTKIVLNNNGTIDIFANKTTYHGDMHVSGNITSDGDQIAGGISQINHQHGGVKRGQDKTDKPSGAPPQPAV